MDFEQQIENMKVDGGVTRRHSGARRFLLLLGFTDLVLAAAGWLGAAAWFGVGLGNTATALALTVYVVLTLLFFGSYHLYNPHLFFHRRRHFVSLFKALAQSGGALGLLCAVFNVPSLWIAAALGVALLLLLADSLWTGFLRSGPFHLFRCCGIVLLALGMLTTLQRESLPPLLPFPVQAAAAYGVTVTLLAVGRFFVVHVVGMNWLGRAFRRQVAVWGWDGLAVQIIEHVIDHNAPFWVAGTVGEGSAPDIRGLNKQMLGPIERLPDILKLHRIDELVITEPGIAKSTLILVLDFCLAAGVTVWLPSVYLPIVDVKLYPAYFCGLPMIRLCDNHWLWLANKIKRSCGVVLGLLILLGLLPVFAVIALAIKLSSPGPIFYVSARVGRYGREFPMVKFRSMRVDNDDQIHKEYVARLIKGEITSGSSDGAPLKIVDDPRVTSVGKVLRKWSLDELPQLFNVIRGDMSLVGPRPCLPYEYELYKDWYKKRNLVRPGITGLWQVAGRSEVDFEDAVLLDLYYVYNRGLWLDLNILIETVGVVLGRRGAH